jgi:hypothetical protein
MRGCTMNEKQYYVDPRDGLTEERKTIENLKAEDIRRWRSREELIALVKNRKDEFLLELPEPSRLENITVTRAIGLTEEKVQELLKDI